MPAILFIIFNRPVHTEKVFSVIRIAKPNKLYIFADGSRPDKSDEPKLCKDARAITENIDWPCDVKRVYQEKNLGCSLGPSTAFDWFFDNEEEGIILEDDCLPDLSFFNFCDILLEKYRTDKRIMLISGCNLGYHLKSDESYNFSRVPNMWGWATWKRSNLLIDYELNDWKHQKNKLWSIYKVFRNSAFDLDLHWYRYWIDKFDRTVSDKNISWWDWQWIYFQTKNKMLSVFPAVNLVTNIGFNKGATHTTDPANPAAHLPLNSISFPLKEPKEIKRNLDYEENCLKWTLFYHRRLPWHFYPRHYLKKILYRKILNKEI